MKKQIKLFFAIIMTLTLLFSAASCTLFEKDTNTEQSAEESNSTQATPTGSGDPGSDTTNTPTTDSSNDSTTPTTEAITNQGIGVEIPCTDGTATDDVNP